LDEVNYKWLRKLLPGHVGINNTYGQTELTSCISNFTRLHWFPEIPLTANLAIPTFNLQIID